MDLNCSQMFDLDLSLALTVLPWNTMTKTTFLSGPGLLTKVWFTLELNRNSTSIAAHGTYQSWSKPFNLLLSLTLRVLPWGTMTNATSLSGSDHLQRPVICWGSVLKIHDQTSTIRLTRSPLADHKNWISDSNQVTVRLRCWAHQTSIPRSWKLHLIGSQNRHWSERGRGWCSIMHTTPLIMVHTSIGCSYPG